MPFHKGISNKQSLRSSSFDKLRIAGLRKLLIVLILVLFNFSLFTFHFSLVFAEDTPLQKADSDYAFQYGKYIETHDNYLSAKNAYSTFKTATSKNDAFTKTKDYLKQVHSLYVSYLLLAKEIGNTFDWGENSQNKNEIAKKIDTEISFFLENSKKIDSTQTLEELPQIATDLSQHIQNTTKPLINNTLITYRITEVKTRVKQMNDLTTQLDGYAKERLPKEKYDAFFANWNSEIKKIQETNKKTLDDADKTFGEKTDSTDKDVLQSSDMTESILEKLKQASSLFEEVLRL